eukprot:GFUD01030311.1.p1 GENE.GFUD01030311.1~~GFUD01030311.1.p1  ORF type:complete len:216 (+),score=32.07 GFUD01030311.1:51-650(+)
MGVFPFLLLMSMVIVGMESCHAKVHTKIHSTVTTGSDNGNSVSGNGNQVSIGGRKKRQSYRNPYDKSSESMKERVALASTKIQSNVALDSKINRAPVGIALKPWHRDYWTTWFECHKLQATGKLAFQVCKKKLKLTQDAPDESLTWPEVEECKERHGFVAMEFAHPTQDSFKEWDQNNDGELTVNEWWGNEGTAYQGLC